MTNNSTPTYTDPQAPIFQRVEDLLARMTLEEKIGQMTLAEKNCLTPDDVRRYALGAVLSGGGGYPAENTPAGWLQMVGGFHEAARQTRLGIPLLYGVDAVHGHNNLYGATIFPHNIGLGTTAHDSYREDWELGADTNWGMSCNKIMVWRLGLNADRHLLAMSLSQCVIVFCVCNELETSANRLPDD